MSELKVAANPITLEDVYKLAKDNNDKLDQILKGLQQFLEFAETMKGHPILAAFAPPNGKRK